MRVLVKEKIGSTGEAPCVGSFKMSPMRAMMRVCIANKSGTA